MNKSKTELGEFLSSTDRESFIDAELFKIHRELVDAFGRHWNLHSLLFLKRQSISRLLFLDFIYKKIIEVPGYIIEFGVQWGATLSVLLHLRGIYEPYNYSRKIIGFDTFEGFVEITDEDGYGSNIGDYRTQPNYEETLSQVLKIQDEQSPINHIKKYELVKGDVSVTLPKWKENNPAHVVSLAFFDMDLYKPTKFALELILERCVLGSVLVFDEFNCEKFPGETKVVFDILGNRRMKRVPNMPYCAYWIVDEIPPQ
jgi:hypothetical protein